MPFTARPAPFRRAVFLRVFRWRIVSRFWISLRVSQAGSYLAARV